ncbi:MAG: tRNA 2-thiouridine(34) synthase MnmA [Acidimicrobiia bacterium]|nr:MAG: tRNA 2-thiouridine(34) synthase MnmA [Acidimicrobiia bacterium]
MKALVAMSGGVDSSVAAALMLEAGFEVIGVTLKQWVGPDGEMPTAGCCTVADAEDARRVAAQLDIPYYVLDYVDEFTRAVVEPFADEYLAGRTPNPCIECNRKVRFSALFDRMDALGTDVLVTGHHARVRRDEAGWHLLRAVDGTKDQSYVLHMLGQVELSRIRLPIGEMTKAEVRERAAALGLRTAAKPDSQDICFVKRDYRSFLDTAVPETARPGPVVATDGTVLGSHQGTTRFTIGQRKGLGIAVGEPRYVVEIRPASAEVIVGTRDDLLVDGCLVSGVTFVAGHLPVAAQVDVKVRYRSKPIPATIEADHDSGGVWRVSFDQKTPSPAPGQSAVFYDGEEVLGGGVIDDVIRSDG